MPLLAVFAIVFENDPVSAAQVFRNASKHTVAGFFGIISQN